MNKVLICSVILGIIIVILIMYYVFPVGDVIGKSMLPTLVEGDSPIFTRIFSRKNPKEGCIYVIQRGDKRAIKRLSKVIKVGIDTYCFFLGDNPSESYDSRQYGYINAKNIVAKVIWQPKH